VEQSATIFTSRKRRDGSSAQIASPDPINPRAALMQILPFSHGGPVTGCLDATDEDDGGGREAPQPTAATVSPINSDRIARLSSDTRSLHSCLGSLSVRFERLIFDHNQPPLRQERTVELIRVK
jgi:hypothetical protein